MSTVSKDIADEVIQHNGTYPGDEHLPPYVRIVEYTNDFNGALAYGLETAQDKGKYHSSPFCHNPRIYWERKGD